MQIKAPPKDKKQKGGTTKAESFKPWTKDLRADA